MGPAGARLAHCLPPPPPCAPLSRNGPRGPHEHLVSTSLRTMMSTVAEGARPRPARGNGPPGAVSNSACACSTAPPAHCLSTMRPAALRESPTPVGLHAHCKRGTAASYGICSGEPRRHARGETPSGRPVRCHVDVSRGGPPPSSRSSPETVRLPLFAGSTYPRTFDHTPISASCTPFCTLKHKGLAKPRRHHVGQVGQRSVR